MTELYHQYHESLVRMLTRRTGDRDRAEDLAQETFLIAYQKIHTWRSSGSFVSWLHTIAYRQFLKFSKSQARQQVMAEVPQQGFDPGNAIQAEILTLKLMSMISAEERACLTLAFAAGMSHSEIYVITNLPLGTVKSHIQRGRKRLQTWLENNDHSIQKAGEGPAKEAFRAGSVA